MNRHVRHALGIRPAPWFSTLIHKYAQTFLPNLIDVENNTAYLSPRLNRKRKDFAVRFRLRDILTVVATLNRTGKLKDFQVWFGCSKSLTANAAPGRTREFRDITVQFRGCESLTAIAPGGGIGSL